MKLFVARLSASITEDNLNELFSAFGEVSSAKVIMDRETGNSKGYAFIEMPNDEEANAAISALNETELDEKNIVVKEANPPQDRPKRSFNRSGGGGGGGFNRGGGGFNRGGSGGGGERRERNFRSGGDRYGDGERRSSGGSSSSGGYDRRGGERRGGSSGGFDRSREDRW